MLDNGNNLTHYEQVGIVPVVQRATALNVSLNLNVSLFLIDVEFIRPPFYKQDKARQTRFRARGNEYITTVVDSEWNDYVSLGTGDVYGKK